MVHTNSAFWSLPSAVLHCFPQRMSPGLFEEDSELRIEPRFDFDGSLKRLRPLGHLATQPLSWKFMIVAVMESCCSVQQGQGTEEKLMMIK